MNRQRRWVKGSGPAFKVWIPSKLVPESASLNDAGSFYKRPFLATAPAIPEPEQDEVRRTDRGAMIFTKSFDVLRQQIWEMLSKTALSLTRMCPFKILCSEIMTQVTGDLIEFNAIPSM